MLPRRDVVLRSDPRVPPDAFRLRAILREHNFKRPFAIIAGLLPRSLPATILILNGHDLSALPRVGAVALPIERRAVSFIVFDFGDVPLAA